MCSGDFLFHSMASGKKYFKRVAWLAAAAGTFSALGFGVLSVDAVQEKIAVAVLKNAGIDASFGEWDSHLFSDFHLKNVELKHRNDVKVKIPDIRVSANLFALIFSSEFSVDAVLKDVADLELAGKRFTLLLEQFSLSNAAGAKNRLTGILSPKKGENPPQAKFEIENENRDTIRKNTFYAWLAGSRNLRLRLNGIECCLEESGAWKISDTAGGKNPPLTGSGNLKDGNLSGTVSARLDGSDFKDFGLLEFVPDWTADAELTIAGQVPEASYVLASRFELRFASPGGTFSGISLLPELRLSGEGELNFSENAFSVKTFSSKLSAVPTDANPVVFAEISVPGELRLSYGNHQTIKVTAAGNASELALLKFNDVPLELANPFIGRIASDKNENVFKLAGTLDGDFALTQDSDGEFLVAGKNTLEIRDFALMRADDILFSEVSASVPIVAFTHENSIGFEVKNANVFGKDETAILSADFGGSRDFVRKKTAVELSLNLNSRAFSQRLFGEFLPGFTGKKFAAKSRVKAEISDAEIDVSEFGFSVFEDGKAERSLLSANTGAFRFNAENPFVGLDGKQIFLRADGFPIALLDPLARGKFFFSGTLDGEIAFIGEKDKFEFSTEKRGMTIRNFSMKNEGGALLLHDLSLRSVENLVNVSRDESGRFRTEVGLKNARLKCGEADRLASGDLYLNFFGRELITLRGDLAGELGEMVRQPLLAPVGNAAGGNFEVHGGWDAVNRSARLEVTCRDVRSREVPGVALEGISLKIEHNCESEAEQPARIQFTLDGSERSSADIRFSKLDFNWREDKTVFDADALAEKIVLEDFLRLAEIFSPKKTVLPAVAAHVAKPFAPEMKEAETIQTESDVKLFGSDKVPAFTKEPAPQPEKSGGSGTRHDEIVAVVRRKQAALPWKNITGMLRFEIRECVVPENRIRDLRGSLTLDPKRGELIAGGEDFFGGSLKTKTVVELRTKQGSDAAGQARNEDASSVYARTKIAVSDSRIYEAVPALRAENPSVIEGKFSFDLDADSEADGFDNLKNHVNARATLSGRNGNIRIFAVNNKNMQRLGKAVDFADNLADIVGVFGGKKVRRTLKSAQKLKDYLSDFPFDVHELRLSYKSGSPILCEKFLLQNDVLKISGGGEIIYTENLPLAEAPIAIRARMDVREDLEAWMTALGILKSRERIPEPDGKTYTVGPEFKFSGTLERISDNLFETLIPEDLGVKF